MWMLRQYKKSLPPNELNQISGGGEVEVIENKIVTAPVITNAVNIPNAKMLTIGVLLLAKL